MVGFYTKQHRGMGEHEFPRYWAQRKGRRFTAGWFSVQLLRAYGGGFPIAPRYLGKIHALRRTIDALPLADRDWMLLSLLGEEGRDILVTEAELLTIAKRRGPDAMLSVLRGKMPSDDPDMQWEDGRNPRYESLRGWILKHAAHLLRPKWRTNCYNSVRLPGL